MSRTSSHLTTVALFGAGALAWAFAGRPLAADRDLAPPLNPLGINGSPYGEVIAMAMQGPIDTHFHVAMFGGGTQQHQHDEKTPCSSCSEEPPAAGKPAPNTQTAKPSIQARWNKLLTSLAKSAETRTNPKPPSEALKRHLRREAEDKLRFAYHLDPSHYANYNSLHFFLTEPAVGTRPELTPSAAKLAQDTIQYCLKQNDDPRPALTAAAACTNILHLMFSDQQNVSPRYTSSQMRECLALLDHCLARYSAIARQWDESKQWDLLSPQRVAECQDRFSFISKIRDAAEKTINRLQSDSPSPHHVAN